MRRDAWEELSRSDFPVPDEPSLSELTAELTEMLGHADHRVREDTALAALRTWLRRGVYDDLLPGLGDGMVAGLGSGAWERRTSSAVVLGACIARDEATRRVPAEQVLTWGDRLVTWWLEESEESATARGADAVAALAHHPACAGAELAVVLDVIGERAVGLERLDSVDRLAEATMAVLRRGLVPTDVVEAWLERLTDVAAYLRALYLLLSLAPDPPPDRADLVLSVIDRLRAVHPGLRTSE